ncbi:hydroxyacid dehydrogenase [Inquilinus limosus]|uniref:hydroxyacid dehydrogenase n=1 Tax=Inquilinus limosus TaxID=171674 RepID=UPI003F17175A
MSTGPGQQPVVALLLTPEMRAQMIPPEAEERLAAAATVRAPGPGELTADNLPRLLDGAVAALTGWGTPPIGDEVLAARPGLALVAHSAGSVRRLVPAAAIESGRIQVSHAAVNIAESVAEFVIAQCLSILREPHRHDSGMKAGEDWFELRRRCLGRLLGAQTVGIVGAGYVGRLVIRLFRAFGARILVSDPYLSAEKAAELGVERAGLDDLLGASDIVSLHAPALPETRHMIGAAQLARLRDGCLFINTARSALIDEAALLAALRTGRFTAALDVFDQEPLPADSPFRGLPNVVLSPHAAGHSADSHRRQGATTVDEICRFLAGEPLRHRVTPAMLATMA